MIERTFSAVPGLLSLPFEQIDQSRNIERKEGLMGLIELLLIVLVIAAIAGGIGVSPLLWLLLLVALVVFFTGGGFGYRRGGRL
jgi:uncharacterized membrane protein YdbT with pleckstrin-like domain